MSRVTRKIPKSFLCWSRCLVMGHGSIWSQPLLGESKESHHDDCHKATRPTLLNRTPRIKHSQSWPTTKISLPSSSTTDPGCAKVSEHGVRLDSRNFCAGRVFPELDRRQGFERNYDYIPLTYLTVLLFCFAPISRFCWRRRSPLRLPLHHRPCPSARHHGRHGATRRLCG
jgi:hypothetical protein